MNNSTNRSLKSRVSPENPFFQDFSVQTNQLAEIPCRLKILVETVKGIKELSRRLTGQREFDRKIGKQGGHGNA